MRHVDDALLVGYADDALSHEERIDVETHLATCAECRARVGEERALAQRAAAVLGTGVPAGEPEMPAFAEILRRSEESHATSADSARRPTSRSWTLPPLAWAAMLVVGLGAAIIARTLLVSPEFTAPAASRAERAESQANVPESPTMAESQDASADPTVVEERAISAPAAGADARVEPAAREEQNALMPRSAVADTDAATVKAAAAEATPEIVQIPPPPHAAARAPEPAPAPPAAPAAPSPQRYAGAVDSARSAADSLQRASELAERAAALEALVVTGAVPPGAVMLDGPDVAWRGTSAAEASAQGTTVQGVPGAPVSSIWIGTAASAWRARVVQEVDGTSVEVIEWRTAPAAAGVSGSLGDGRGYLFTVKDSTTLLLRAALPIERLLELAATIEPLD